MYPRTRLGQREGSGAQTQLSWSRRICEEGWVEYERIKDEGGRWRIYVGGGGEKRLEGVSYDVLMSVVKIR